MIISIITMVHYDVTMRMADKELLKKRIKELLDCGIEIKTEYAGMFGLTERELLRILDLIIFDNKDAYNWIEVKIKVGAKKNDNRGEQSTTRST